MLYIKPQFVADHVSYQDTTNCRKDVRGFHSLRFSLFLMKPSPPPLLRHPRQSVHLIEHRHKLGGLVLFRDKNSQRHSYTRAILCTVALVAAPCFAQTIHYTKRPEPKNGKLIYNGGCIACHGSEGKGAPQSMTVFP